MVGTGECGGDRCAWWAWQAQGRWEQVGIMGMVGTGECDGDRHA